MYLLHTTTLQLHEIIGSDVPKYAILSHTWGDDEVLFRHIWNSQVPSNDSAGFLKISNACAKAKEDGWEYIWIDTCCINKESSAELSESINSMYRWYKDAEICYAFLADVSPGGKELKDSRWFTRGWTLQELLAPRRVEFYGMNWAYIGYKGVNVNHEFREMSEEISVATGIDRSFLKREAYVDASIAQRMSWVAKRQTKRSEDMSYCLLGIFDVNMPLLYGEGGEKAFLRLQSEIIKVSTDESIFAWSNPSLWTSGLLARSPHEFAASGKVRKYISEFLRQPVSITSHGLEIEIPVDNLLREESDYFGHYEVPLDCGTDLRTNFYEPDNHIALRFAIMDVRNTKMSNKSEVFEAIRTGVEQLHTINYLNRISKPTTFPKQTRSCYFQNMRFIKTDEHQYIQLLPQSLASPTMFPGLAPPVLILQISQRLFKSSNLALDLGLAGGKSCVLNSQMTLLAPSTQEQSLGLLVGAKSPNIEFYDMLLTWRYDSKSRAALEICLVPNPHNRIFNNHCRTSEDPWFLSNKWYLRAVQKEFSRDNRNNQPTDKCLFAGDTFSGLGWEGCYFVAFSVSLTSEKLSWIIEMDFTQDPRWDKG